MRHAINCELQLAHDYKPGSADQRIIAYDPSIKQSLQRKERAAIAAIIATLASASLSSTLVL
jgi:hypothetical protein